MDQVKIDREPPLLNEPWSGAGTKAARRRSKPARRRARSGPRR